MSEQNVEIVREAYEALADALRSGDFALPIDRWWDPECVLKPAGLFPEAAEMHGHDGLRRFVATQADAFESMQVEPLDFIDAGDRIVAQVRFGGLARHTGLEIDFSIVHVFTLRDKRILRLDMYRTKPEALEAVGLRN